MKSKMLKMAFGCACVLGMNVFVGCGDENSGHSAKVDNESSDVADLELADGKAVVCDDDMEGVVAITKDDGYRKCVDGEWVKITRREAMEADEIIGVDEDDDDENDESSSSSIKSNSSSVIPSGVEESQCDEMADQTRHDECESSKSSSSRVIPGADPYSSASTSVDCTSYPLCGESSSAVLSADIKADGYYQTNCPSGKTCSYVSTEYLNATIIYGEFLDTRDNQVYKTVTIGTQTWMAQNLNYAYTGVPFSFSDYTSDSTSWCYNNVADSCAKYGRLYTWAAAIDSVALANDADNSQTCGYGVVCDRFTADALAANPLRGVCPSGWHLPSNAEWNALFTAVGGINYAGESLKSTSGYSSGNGEDSFGFSVLLAGIYDGGFCNVGGSADFWSSTEDNSNYAYGMSFYYGGALVNVHYSSKNNGRSVRCLRNSKL